MGLRPSAVNPEEIAGYLHLLCCPACFQSISIEGESLVCSHCSRKFEIADGIPLLNNASQDGGSGSREIKARTARDDDHPSPRYHASEDLSSLIDRAHEDSFACLLDQQLLFGTRILDCGCGTGLLSNFLAIAHRTVFGMDLSTNALLMADEFRRRNRLERVHFLQMNLYSAAFKPDSFDAVLCNNVLRRADEVDALIQALSRLIKHSGYLVLGLHHSSGHFWTAPFDSASRLTGRIEASIRNGFRGSVAGVNREETALVDRNANPQARISLSRLDRSLASNGLRRVKTIPIRRASAAIASPGKIFERGPAESLPSDSATDWSILAGGFGGEGFFVTIARKQ